MDPRSNPPTTHLKPPPSHPQRTPSPSSTSSTPPSRPPISAHPSATISDSVLLQGTCPISIDAETIIHPRARIFSFTGPVSIGRGCVIGEKSVVGCAPSPASPGVSGDAREEQPIHISNAVTLSPLATVHPGVRLDEAVIVDSLATVHRGARVGRHSKICAGCVVPARARVGEWMVLWGSGGGFGRRKRVAMALSGSTGLDGRVVEESRLVVLRKEREALGRLLVPAGGSRRR